MKTKILEWDLNLQLLCLLTLPLLYWWLRPGALVVWQVTLLLYLLASNSVELRLHHRSLGFNNHRRLLGLALTVYLFVTVLVVIWGGYFLALPAISLLFPVTDLALLIYWQLCRRELRFLRKREFFILK